MHRFILSELFLLSIFPFKNYYDPPSFNSSYYLPFISSSHDRLGLPSESSPPIIIWNETAVPFDSATWRGGLTGSGEEIERVRGTDMEHLDDLRAQLGIPVLRLDGGGLAGMGVWPGAIWNGLLRQLVSTVQRPLGTQWTPAVEEDVKEHIQHEELQTDSLFKKNPVITYGTES